MQEQSWQRQSERQEGAPGCAVKYRSRCEHAGPAARPTIKAVPVQFATARRQVGRSVPLNLIISGSVARPRDALRERVRRVAQAEGAELPCS